MAATAQCPFGYAGAEGKLCYRKIPVALRVQHLFELGHDNGVPLPGCRAFPGVPLPGCRAFPGVRFRKGADQSMKKVLLQCPRDFTMR